MVASHTEIIGSPADTVRDFDVIFKEMQEFLKGHYKWTHTVRRAFQFPGSVEIDFEMENKAKTWLAEWKSALKGLGYPSDGVFSDLVNSYDFMMSVLKEYLELNNTQGPQDKRLEKDRLLFGDERSLSDNAEGACGMFGNKLGLAMDRVRLLMMCHDPLTGLPNRLLLEDFKNKIPEEVLPKLYVFVVDVDHFKRINDTYGHPVGDAVLKEVGNILSGTVRHENLLQKTSSQATKRTRGSKTGPRGVFRTGGEEFVALIPATEEEVHVISERIHQEFRKRFEKGFSVDGVHISGPITVSMGTVSLLPLMEEGVSRSDLFSRAIKIADEMVYLAKNKGRNRTIMKTETGIVELTPGISVLEKT